MKVWISVLLVPSLALADSSNVPKADTMTLSDVLKVAVQQAPALAYAALDAKAAEGRVQQAKASTDVLLGADAGVGAGVGTVSGDKRSAFAGLGVGKQFATGTVVTASAGYDWAKATSGAAPGSIYGATIGAAIQQPLLRGFGADATLGAQRQAALQRSAATLAAEAQARATVRDIAVAYWQVALAHKTLEVRQTSLSLTEKQLKITDAMITNQLLAKSDRWVVEQAIATHQQNILAAEESVWQTSLRLRQLAGLPISSSEIAIATDALPETANLPEVDVPARIERALAGNADLAALELTTKAADAAAAEAVATGRRPLDLSLSYERSARDTSAGGPFGELGGSSATWDAGATLTYGGGSSAPQSIRNLAGAGAVQVAEAERRRAHTRLLESKAAVAGTAAAAAQRLRSAKARIALATTSSNLADQTVKAEQKRFEMGKSTIFEVLRRQDEVQQAQLRHLAAIADYLTAQAELDAMSGDILAQYAISIPPR